MWLTTNVVMWIIVVKQKKAVGMRRREFKNRDEMTKCHFILPKHLHREFKKLVIDEDESMSSVITEFVRRYVEERKTEK